MKKIKRDLSHDSKNLLAYQKDIENYKPLTKIQEEELGERILQGDAYARQELIEGYLSLVFKCANDCWTPKVPFDELVAAGNLGLVVAASRFDPQKNRRFLFYAKHYVKDAIKNAIHEYNSTMHIPRGVDNNYYFMSFSPAEDEFDGDEDWVRPFIDTIAAAPEYWENDQLIQDFLKEARDILGPHFNTFDLNLLLEYAQKIYEGYTIKDLAFEYHLSVKKMKALINELHLKANSLNLRSAFSKAA